MRSYSKAAGETWVTPVWGTVATTAVTSHSNTITTHVTVTAGDMALGFFFYRDNTTQTSPTFTQSGVTYGTVAEYPSTALTTTTSNDIAADACHRLASSGTSTAAPVMTHTTSTVETGAYAFVRLRVSTPTNAPAQNATATGTANNAAVKISPAAQNAPATGTAENATVPTFANALTASLAATSEASSGIIAPSAPTASITGSTASAASISVPALYALGTLVADNPTVDAQSSVFFVWDGTSELPAELFIWNGSTELPITGFEIT
jgi:hypothetical protein